MKFTYALLALHLLALSFILSTVCQAAEIQWVGNQSDYDVLNHAASFHDGINWLNFVPPDEDGSVIDDIGVFGSGFDPQNNQTAPHYLYFGTFQTHYQPPASSPRIPAKDAVIRGLEIRTGEWDFDFGSNILTPGEITADGSLTVEEYIYLGTPFQSGATATAPAKLTIHNGTLTQSVPQTFHGFDIGRGPGTSGHLIVDGPDAAVVAVSNISLGEFGGTGRLDVINGGHVAPRGVTTGLSIGPAGEKPTGHLTIRGPGSLLSGLFGMDNGTIHISEGGVATSPADAFAFIGASDGRFAEATVTGQDSAWTGPARITIGGVYHTDTTGHGELSVLDGGLVSCGWLVVANRSLSQGELYVSGEGSEVRAEIMTLGDDGKGTVRLKDRARLVSTAASIGDTVNGIGDVSLEDHSIWENAGSLAIGRIGKGLLKVANGSRIASAGGGIGVDVGSAGSVTVEENSDWTITGGLTVGGAGTGTLVVANAGEVTLGTDLVIADAGLASVGNVSVQTGGTLSVGNIASIGSGGTGELVIDAGVVQVAGQTQVGGGSRGGIAESGTGRLSIRNGGSLTSNSDAPSGISATMGAFSSEAHSTASITGAASAWLQTGTFNVGSVGAAELQVKDGGYLECVDAQVARASTAVAHVSVDGAGSRWLVRDRLMVGGSFAAPGGKATVDVSNGGTISVAKHLKLWRDGELDLSGGGAVEVGNADPPPGAGSVTIGEGGTLSGDGTIVGNVLVDGGTIAPGTSPGALHINGNFHQSASGLLALQIGGTTPATQYDQLLVTGNLLLEGTVQIQFIDGFVPQPGDTFNLLSGASVALSGPLAFVNAPPNFQYATSLSSGQFSLTVVPEPSSLLMVCMAFITMYAAARRANYQNA